jgi:AcrR family transcriptional regulator
MFAHNGYSKTTLHSVSDRVGLTRQGVLHHFHSKEGLFREVINEGQRWAKEQDDASGGVTGSAGLRALSRFVRTTQDVHIRLVHTLQAEAMHEDAPEHVVTYVCDRLEHIRCHIAERLREGQRDGTISADLDAPALATMITGTINGLQTQALLDPTVDVEAAFDALADLLAGDAAPRMSDSPVR